MAVVVVVLGIRFCASWPGKLLVMPAILPDLKMYLGASWPDKLLVNPVNASDDGIGHLSRPLVLNDEGRG